MRVVLSSVLLSLALSGCASAAGSGRGASRDPNLINNEELRQAEVEGLSATELIERLRSRWLQGRGATSLSNPASGYARVVLNGAPYGELDVLLNMNVSGIEEMRFLNARDATTLSANVRETRSTQRIRVGRRQRKRTCWDCEREWKRMVVPLEPGRPSEARQLLRTQR